MEQPYLQLSSVDEMKPRVDSLKNPRAPLLENALSVHIACITFTCDLALHLARKRVLEQGIPSHICESHTSLGPICSRLFEKLSCFYPVHMRIVNPYP